MLRLTCRANMYWEANLPRGFRRPPEGDIVGCKKFIEEKYRYECPSPASLAQSTFSVNVLCHVL